MGAKNLAIEKQRQPTLFSTAILLLALTSLPLLQAQAAPKPLSKPSREIPKTQKPPAESPANRPVKDKWAIVVGVSKFARPALNLRNADKDARDFYDYLVKEANFAPTTSSCSSTKPPPADGCSPNWAANGCPGSLIPTTWWSSSYQATAAPAKWM
ncbi:MAG: hypothetical protein HC888_10630 [Candidatus Competibacteraceae bacterium]|nr:hypothetical protein [Candidatus Competibacteraceae bacterium]